MTFAGAFAHFYLRDGSKFTLRSIRMGDFDQVTGARIPESQASSLINGSMDTLTEEDLQLVQSGQLPVGTSLFHTEVSYGVKVGDIVVDPTDSRRWRVLQRKNIPRIINDRFPTMDVESYYVEATK